DTFDYRKQQRANFPALEMISNMEILPDRLKALLASQDRAAVFVRDLLSSVVDYAASRIPEIADAPEAVDQAMRWGFAWELGPFELARVFKGETPSATSFIKKQRVIEDNPGASLRDLGDGVACLEFHSKMNTIG